GQGDGATDAAVAAADEGDLAPEAIGARLVRSLAPRTRSHVGLESGLAGLVLGWPLWRGLFGLGGHGGAYAPAGAEAESGGVPRPAWWKIPPPLRRRTGGCFPLRGTLRALLGKPRKARRARLARARPAGQVANMMRATL